MRDLDALLRSRGRYAAGSGDVPWLRVALIVGACGFAYGMVMGAFGARPLQALYSGTKVPLLVGIATLLCLPNFYVVNTVLGLRDDFAASVRGVLVSQGTVAITLLALAPLTALQYASVPQTMDHYQGVILFNGLMFAMAALGGQVSLARHYRELIARNPRHRVGRTAWLALYVFVAIQLAWTLRPFIGNPEKPTQFFRQGAWGNAYVEVALIVWRQVFGGP